VAEFRFCRDDQASRHFFEVPVVARPAGVETQWLCFCFRSRGMQTASPASHFAVVLRAELGRDAGGQPCSISGRGLTLGDTSQAATPAHCPGAEASRFGGARGLQVESFWPGGNFLYRGARLLDAGLRDDTDYRVHLHVRDDRWVGVWLAAADGEPLPGQHVAVQDHPGHPVLAERSGVIIALGRGAENGAFWEARFSEIAWGWC
jgi:hypothetical protein